LVAPVVPVTAVVRASMMVPDSTPRCRRKLSGAYRPVGRRTRGLTSFDWTSAVWLPVQHARRVAS
jgi:hypothetical protein